MRDIAVWCIQVMESHEVRQKVLCGNNSTKKVSHQFIFELSTKAQSTFKKSFFKFCPVKNASSAFGTALYPVISFRPLASCFFGHKVVSILMMHRWSVKARAGGSYSFGYQWSVLTWAAEGAAGICHGPHPPWVKQRPVKLRRGVHIGLLLMSLGQLWICRDAMMAVAGTKLS